MGEISTRQLTEKQAAFVRHMADTGDAIDAARRAGYSQNEDSTFCYHMLRLPHIAAALHLAVRKRLTTSAPIALKIVLDIAQDESVSPKTRLDAAKTILDRAGHVAPRAAAEKPADQPLHEMTTDQLRELAGRLEDEIAGRAKPVSSAQLAPDEQQAIDVIG